MTLASRANNLCAPAEQSIRQNPSPPNSHTHSHTHTHTGTGVIQHPPPIEPRLLQNDLLYVNAFLKRSEITWATASPNLAAQKIGVVDVVLPGPETAVFARLSALRAHTDAP